MNLAHNYSRRSFLKSFATAGLVAPFITRDLLAQPRDGILRHASFGASGMAWADLTELTKFPNVKLVAVAEVDLNRTAELRKKFPDVKIYQDWRKLLEKEGGNIDSVNVSTPDHTHAVMAMSALHLGKHVYCQKPLAHDLFEVRQLTRAAKKEKTVTQMGIQIHSDGNYQLAAKLVQDGVIGKIKEVHSWCQKSWGDANPRPERADPVPAGFDWDLWLCVCEARPFINDNYYHPGTWRKRLDFGTGTFGDMGCHIFDPIFMALGLGAPLSVRSEGQAPNQWNWASNSLIHYVFPGTERTANSTLPVTWYDGTQKLPPEVLSLLEGDQLPDTGSIFVGSEGTMVLPHISRPLLYPDKKYQDFKYPKVSGEDHWGQFVQACLGQGKTSAHFGYSGPLAEAVLLGTVASRFPQTTLNWNAARLSFDLAEANHFIRRKYRSGWSVRGLA